MAVQRIARINELSTTNCADKRMAVQRNFVLARQLRLVQRITRINEWPYN